MDVMLLTIAFPRISEAFAGVEVRSLRACGASVRVRALRSADARRIALLRDWRLQDLDLTSWTLASVVRGCVFVIRHPWMATSTLAWLLGHGYTRPVLLMRCILLTPRLFDIFSECLANPPEVLYLFWGHYPSMLAYMTGKWLPKVHVAMSLNAYDLEYAFPPSVDMARNADSLWTSASANVRTICALGIDPSRIRVNPRGIDFEQVPTECWTKDRDQLVTVARLEAYKGVDHVIRAFHAVSDEYPHVRLTIIGEGPDRARLEGIVSEMYLTGRVEFVGGIPHSEVYKHLGRASVLLLLSESEHLPNAVKEAMACRCLYIVTETPGIDYLLMPVDNKMVVGQRDWRGAAKWLATVLSDPARFECDRDSARSFVLTKLDALQTARERLRVWKGET